MALVAGTATIALADVKRVGGHISLNTGATGVFKGKVKSSRKFCFRNRLVVLKRSTPGKDRTIGRDRTNRRGRYRIDLGHPVTGNFYARATRKIRIISGNGIVCRPIQSSVIHISP
jgi:hypothetical protein